MAIRKNIHNLSQGPPNPGFMQKKVQKGLTRIMPQSGFPMVATALPLGNQVSSKYKPQFKGR